MSPSRSRVDLLRASSYADAAWRAACSRPIVVVLTTPEVLDAPLAIDEVVKLFDFEILARVSGMPRTTSPVDGVGQMSLTAPNGAFLAIQLRNVEQPQLPARLDIPVKAGT